MGFGLIKVVNKKMHFVQMNELHLKKYEDPYTKLKLIFDRTVELIDTFHPDEMAIEAPFFGKNVQSMLIASLVASASRSDCYPPQDRSLARLGTSPS